MPEIIGLSKSIYGFDPRSIAGCSLWLDGADSNATANISTGVWLDKSGNAYNTTSNSGSSAFSMGSINSVSAVTFPAASASALIANVPVASANGISAFVVASTTTNASGSSRILNSYPSGLFQVYLNGSSLPTYVGMYANASTLPAPAPTISSGVPFLYSGTVSVANFYEWISGVSGGTTGVTANPFTGSSMYIGNWIAPSNVYAFTGQIGEILIYSNVLTNTQRQTVEGYLAWKWGLTSNTFVPNTSISGCTTWYDASDPATWIVSNGFMQSITDKSGSGNNLNASGIGGSSNWPVLGSINGLPAMMFGTTNQGSSNTVSLAYTTNSITLGPTTVFCVAMFTGYPCVTPGSAGYAQIFMDNYAGQRQCFMNNGSSNTFSSNSLVYFEAQSSGNYYNTPGIQVRGSNIPFLIACSYTTSGSTLVWGNGNASPGSGAATSTGSSQWYIGGGNGGAQAINACIGEFITYNSQLTAAQRQQVESYLMSKWGIDYTASLISNPTNPTTIYSQSISNQPYVNITPPKYISNSPFASLQPFTRLFQPTDIPGCVVWLDAADGTATGGGTTITSWKDKSSIKSTLTANGTINMTTINGLPAVALAGVSLTGYFTGGSLPYTGSKLTIFTACTFNGFGGLRLFSFGVSGTVDYTGSGYGFFGAASGPVFTGFKNAAFSAQSPIISTGTPYVTSYVWDGTNANIDVNGGAVASAAQSGGNFAITNYAVGIDIVASSADSAVWWGNVGEILVFSNALTTAQRQQIEGYLGRKWGISLPATHPYYSIQPSTQTGEIYKKFPIAVLDPTVGLNISGGVWYETIAGVLSNATPGWRSTTGQGWTVSGAPTTVSTGPSVALSMNGTSQYVYNGAYAQMGAFTIDIWIYPTAVRNACVVGETGTGGYNYTLLYLSSAGGIYSGPYFYNSGAGLGMGVGSYTSNQWYNIVITNTGGTNNTAPTPAANSSLVSYVNGVQTNSAVYVRSAPGAPVYIAVGSNTAYNSQSTGYFQGYVGGFKLYAVALSPAQVQQNYNAWAWRFKMPLTSTPLALPGGLVFHLDAANKQSYPGSGTTWTDLVSGLAMTLNNGPTFSNVYGGYINFVPGSSQYASIGTSLQTTPSWSVEVWHYYTNTTNNTSGSPAIVSQVYPGATYCIQFMIGNVGAGSGSVQMQTAFYNASSWYSNASYVFPASNIWYHIVGTYDGSNLRTYINSSNVSTTATTTVDPSNSSGFYLMRRWDNPDYWGGGLATVRIYSKSLSSSEINTIFSATRSRFNI